MSADVCSEMPVFRKPKKRVKALRQLKADDLVDKLADESGPAADDEQLSSVLAGVRDLQKLRNKPHGLRRDADVEDEIKQQFSKETLLRDEDEEMRKFVDSELHRKTGKQGASSDANEAGPSKKMRTTEDLFREAAETVKVFSAAKTEEMLSNQMLSGIPEVDLGIEAKIRNIEQTEAEKLRLLQETVNKEVDLRKNTAFNHDLVRELAPKYVQHQRFEIGRTTDISSNCPAAANSRLAEKQLQTYKHDDADAVVGSTPDWHHQGNYTPQFSGDTPFWSIANGDLTPGVESRSQRQGVRLAYMPHL